MISVDALSLVVRDAAILTDISLQIPPTGITALIGPNGAGKSTLLHSLAALKEVSSGKVRIDGIDPFALPAAERAKLVAVLQQNPDIVPRLAVADMVAFGRWPHHQGRPQPEDRAAITDALRAFDLTDLADRPLDTLSGGQRQRAMVAMAWAQSTPWLFLDEPLNALDPRYARDLMDRLHHLSRPGPAARSVVVVLHDINAAARWADHVVAMKDGRVHAAGTTAEVLTKPVLDPLYDTAFDEVRSNGHYVLVPG